MKVTINDQSETRKDVLVTIEADEITAEEQKIVKQFMKEAKVRGFRPGKVPESRVRQLYGKEILQELKRSLMNLAVVELDENHDLEIVSVVDFPAPEHLQVGQELTLDLTIDVNPAFELPEYTGLELEVPSTDVSDEEIDQFLDNIRRQRADFVVVERAAAAEDYVKVSYEASVDGEDLEALLEGTPQIKAWGTIQNAWEEAGTEQAKAYGVPAVIDGIVGMAVGDTKTVDQTVPDEFPVEALRGKTITYSISVGEVRERQLPEIDEDFLKSVNAESLEDLKAQIMDNLEQQKTNGKLEAKHTEINKQLSEAVDFPLPESSVESERERAMGRILSQSYAQGMTEDYLESHKEEIFARATELASRDVKLNIIFSRIAKKEGISIDNEDLAKAAYSVAMQRRQKTEDFVKELRKDSAQLREFQKQVLMAKTSEFIASKASEKTISA